MRRVEWMAVGWGGLVCGIGLVVGADTPGAIKLSVAGVIVALAGFLAGVRAEDRRILHAGFAAVAGVGFYLVFVLLTWMVQAFGGPRRATLIPAGRADWPWHIGGLVLVALVGGTIAALRLRPQGDQRTRRRYPEA